ncbi:DNA polymerase III subunit delta' [Janthinobacterium sp. 17J80-10]|uniref:DNA polymerase III subunit delta' n=1 Tax=Janthinobacterium sp. 17J80-10 TaxID=2497863 RepID=UPI001005A8FA|nr:DNA polymerase III subunit delta' [Janthinobacterium sp. 17J80-10]QAU34590.1 DNA polymerase III subunit delta' [Janthinobacterium sp. 17J80-10]
MNSAIFPWQEAAWSQLQSLRARLPHAILFHGPAGIGKTAFALGFAQALLCETPDATGHACGKCSSCGWFAQYSHPDFRRVRPEVLEDDENGAGDEDDEAAEPKKTGKSTKAPSKDIRIDQVRALADFMNISTHRQGKRVVLLYPAEALNGAAANALLKTLEEPPPNTVFVLVSNSLDRLLPTILSRCRKFSLDQPPLDQALAWLKAQGVSNAEDWLAEQGGAPLAAQQMAESGNRETMEEFLQHLARPGVEGALKTAEKMLKTAPAQQVEWLQRWLYDLFSIKLSGKIRYYPRYQKQLLALGGQVETPALLRAIKDMGERRAIAEHPLSPKLFIEDMLLDYTKLYSR